MKILVIVHGFPPAACGGTEIYADAHSRVLHARFGDEVVVLTREQDPARSEFVVRSGEGEGRRVVWVNNTFRRTRSFAETYQNEAIDTVASGLIDEFRPDVAHIHHLTCLSTGIVPLLAARRIPSVMTLHDYWLLCHRGQLLDVNYQVCGGPEPEGCRSCVGPAGGAGRAQFIGATAVRELERYLPVAPARLLRQTAMWLARGGVSNGTERAARERLDHMRAIAGRVTCFIAPSQSIRDRFMQFGVPSERIRLAGYGVDPVAFQFHSRASSTPARPLRLAFVGSLMVSKAPHLLLEAVGQLPAGSVSVDVIGGHSAYHGDDSYRVRLQPLMDRDGVRVLGPVAHDRMASALAAVDAVVVPSIWPENSPFVIHEAFLAGLPVVAARIGGVPELVRDGLNGLLFSPGDSGDLLRVLKRLIVEPGLLDRLRAGITPVRTLEADVAATRMLYQELIDGRPTVGPAGGADVGNYERA